MEYTYKLDEKGIPYRIVLKQSAPATVRGGIRISHRGARKSFQLYLF